MEEKYLIIMDVSGDVNPETAAENDVKFLPMEYSIGKSMRSCEGMESEDALKLFYNGQRNGDLTKTTQISPYMYEEYLEPYFKEGYSVLYLCLSSGLSSTYSSACIAKQALKEKYPELDLYPVDTLAATGGMGVLCERAINNKKHGLSIKDNFNDIEYMTQRIKHWFLVKDLMYLKRGGRVSAASAAVGTMLNVVPILKIDEKGKLINIAKKRGMKAAVRDLVERFAESYDSTTGDVIYVIDADANELGEQLKEEILKLYPDAEVRRRMLSPIIGAHTGPGMAAICHMGK